MTMLRGLLGARASIESPQVPISSDTILELIGGEARGHAGKRITETTALGMSAVWRAVTVIAGVAASLPFHAYRTLDDGSRVPAVGNAAALMDQPHPDMTPMELWELVWCHLELWGNAYLWVQRDGADIVTGLWPLHPSRVRVGRARGLTGEKVYSVDDGALVVVNQGRLPRLLHIPGFGYDGVCGVSPVRMARESIGTALAAEEYAGRLFGSGSLATGVLQTEQRLTQEQADALRERWRAKRTGLASAHETIVLDSGAQFHQLTIPPADAQFLESRRFQTTEVCRWFGLPPFLMHETEKSTSWGTGLEQQALGWVVYDLRRKLTRVEQRMTQLLRPQAVYARHNLEGLLRGDSAARSAFYTALWNIGVLSTNEIRELEERAPVEGGDVRYRPLAMGELGQADPDPGQTEDPMRRPDAVPLPRLPAAR